MVVLMFCILIISACFNKTNKKEVTQTEKDCLEYTKIEGLSVYFYGYFPHEADTIQVKIKRGNKIIKEYSDKIPETISDSLRHLREYSLKNEILLTDTLILKIKNELEKKAYNFKYLLRPHFTMTKSDYACDYYEVTVNNEVISGGNVSFRKPGFDNTILNQRDLKAYYKNTGKPK